MIKLNGKLLLVDSDSENQLKLIILHEPSFMYEVWCKVAQVLEITKNNDWIQNLLFK